MESTLNSIASNGAAVANLHRSIQDEFNNLSSVPWTVSIPFEMMEYSTSASTTLSTYKVDNILEYCKPIFKGSVIRFPIAYNDENKGIKALRDDLNCAALQCSGTHIVGANTGKRETVKGVQETRWALRCNHAIIYTGKKFDSTTSSIICNPECRNSSLHNDCKNNRGPKGISMAKRTSTKARMCKNDPKCPFLLPIFYDGISYFIKGGLGCAEHQYHVHLNPTRETHFPTALLSDEDRQLMVVATFEG
jgi:hypothetical protein